MTTVAWWGAAVLFWALGLGSRGRHLAWLVFGAIALAAWLGAPQM